MASRKPKPADPVEQPELPEPTEPIELAPPSLYPTTHDDEW